MYFMIGTTESRVKMRELQLDIQNVIKVILLTVKDINESLAGILGQLFMVEDFFSKGCLSGSLVQHHILSFPLPLVMITRLSVLFEGGLENGKHPES